MNIRSDLRNASGWISLLALVNAAAGFALSASNTALSSSGADSATFLVAALLAQHLTLSLLVAVVLWLFQYASGGRMLLKPAAVVLFSFYLLIVFIDTKVFGLYRFHLNAMVINLVFGGALQDNLAFSARQWGGIALIGAAVIGLQAIAVALCSSLLPASATYAFAVRHSGRRRLSLRLVAAPALLLVLVTQLTYAWHDARGNVAITSQARYVPWFAPITMKRALRRMGVEVKAGQAGTLAAQAGSSLRYPLQPLDCGDVPAPFNIVVLMVDSLRFDMIDTATMPHVTAFAQTAIRFENHFSAGNSTRFGVFGFFYGLPASYWNAMLSEQRGAVLIDRLVAMDYALYVEASAPLISPEFDRTIFARVREQIRWAPAEFDIAARDLHATNALNQKIASHDHSKPFFGFLFLDAPHGYGLPKNYDSPFQPMLDDVNYLSLGPDTDPERFFNRYRASVHYNDGLLASVIENLQREKLLDRTIVIITSDHGQEFNDLEKNYWGHNSNYSDFQIKVPLVIHWPRRTSAVVTEITSHEDIVPTLMQETLGCNNAVSDYSTGRNLFDHDAINTASQDRSLVVESWSDRAIIHGDRIYQFPGFGAAQVYDRRYNPQPDETPATEVINTVLRQMSAYMQ